MKSFKRLFETPHPKVGEIWFSESDNPFAKPRRTEIEILDTKEGYVLYRFAEIGGIECSAHEDYIKLMYEKKE